MSRKLSVAAGMLNIPPAEVLPLQDIARAHELLENDRPAGRILLDVTAG